MLLGQRKQLSRNVRRNPRSVGEAVVFALVRLALLARGLLGRLLRLSDGEEDDREDQRGQGRRPRLVQEQRQEPEQGAGRGRQRENAGDRQYGPVNGGFLEPVDLSRPPRPDVRARPSTTPAPRATRAEVSGLSTILSVICCWYWPRCWLA